MSQETQPHSFFSTVTGQHHRSENVSSTEYSSDSYPEEQQSQLSEPHQMAHESRRVLVYLLRQGVILATQKPKLFALLCRYERDIRRHLSEVYLQLILDQKAGVAFIAYHTSEHTIPEEDQNKPDDGIDEIEDEEAATLISRRTLSLFDTLILLVLRKHYQDRESAGEQKITIDVDRLGSYLTPFLPLTDHSAQDRKKLIARVKEMVRRKILSSIRGSEDRYEITPIIRYVVNASFLEEMLAQYSEIAAKTDTNDSSSEQKYEL